MTREHRQNIEATRVQPNRFALEIRRGAKYGALVGSVGGVVVVVGAVALALLKVPVFGRQLVLEGSAISNIIGASISVVAIAICGTFLGAMIKGMLALIPIRNKKDQ
jgi:hypothetical protein